jgi:hypothetical protein
MFIFLFLYFAEKGNYGPVPVNEQIIKNLEN